MMSGDPREIVRGQLCVFPIMDSGSTDATPIRLGRRSIERIQESGPEVSSPTCRFDVFLIVIEGLAADGSGVRVPFSCSRDSVYCAGCEEARFPSRSAVAEVYELVRAAGFRG